LVSLAFIRFNQNYIDEALNLYLRALKQSPENPKIHRQLGYIYKAKGQSRLSIETFKVYLNLNPTARDKATIEAIIKDLK